MKPLSCIVTGKESLLVACAQTLLQRGHDIRAVVSVEPAIRSWAEQNGLPLYARADQVEQAFDWLFSIANLDLIPESVLTRARCGAINFHDGPLPHYAGLNTPNWALLEGAREYGITWHMIESGVDMGDIVARRLFDVAEDETAYSLNTRCYGAAMDAFGEVLAQIESGQLVRQPQDLTQRRYFARADRPAAGARLDFTRPAGELVRLVRALDFGGYWNPLCAARIATAEQVVLVSSAEVVPEEGAAPGSVTAVDRAGVTVATGEGAIRLTGLTTTTGAALEPQQLFALGDSLALLDDAEAAKLSAALAATQKGETHWRRALASMHPVPVPLASGPVGDAAGSLRLQVARQVQLDDTYTVAAILVWALLSSGEESADLALSTAAMAERALPGYVESWVPLQARRDERVADLLARVEAGIERAERLGSFAADLVARAPELSPQDMPGIAIALAHDGPVAGSVLTVSLHRGELTVLGERSRLDDRAIELLADRLRLVLSEIGVDGDLPVRDLPLLPAAEKALLLQDWNRTATDYPAGLTVHAAFEAQADRTPEATALVFEGQSFSYAAVEARANAVASRLVAMGVERGSHVGLYVNRSPDLVIGALAIMKAGGAYVPLDPAYPADRIAHYVRDSGARVIITQQALAASLPPSEAGILEVDGITLTDANEPRVDGGAAGQDLAYLIYTSGSTGVPKGVMVRHGNVSNFFTAMDQRIPHREGDSWLAVTSLSFDISVLELFWTLSRGLKLVLSSDESRLQLSNGPVAVSDRGMDFNLFYWGNDDGPGPKKYQLLLEGAKFADAHGFNAVWTPERHFHAFGGPYPNPAVTGAAVAAVTRNLSVRAGSCVAPLHHPARIAEEWAVIDNLTAGRAAIGFASGWQPDDFILRPENTPPANKDAMFDALETVRKLWRGEEVAFPRQDGGEFAVVTQPRPVSKELAAWVTTAGNPETWRQAGQLGANVLTHLLGQSIDEVGDKIRIYHDALRQAGHDPADFRVTLMLHTYLAGSRDEARRVAREPMKDYLRSAAGLIKQYAWAFPAFKKPQGVANPMQLDLGSLAEEEMEAILDFAFERYFEDSGLFGTIPDGVQRVEQLKRIGVDEIACLIDYGIEPATVMAGLEPLAEVLRLSNAPVELAEDDFSLAAQIVRHDVTHMQCTPSMARMIAMNDEANAAIGRLRHLLVGGEALPGDLVGALRAATGASIHNMYGPTETTIWSTVQTLEATPPGVADIGTPIANTSVYVLDQRGQPAPVGVPGELYIGGEGVTAGYWQREELTAERFLPDPFACGTARMYRTGDLVRWRADGRLDFLGRTDHQVKIRGHRIELGEIEAAIAAYPGVTGAVVMPRRIGEGERLVGYITVGAPVAEQAILRSLANSLSDVMVPAHIVTLDTFPLTPNKKIDRKALPDPQPAMRSVAEPATPATGAQARIAAIWSRMLGVEGIGAQDNFFTLGGHSLLAVQAHREIREELGAERLSITDIFRFPTLAGLAAHYESLTGGDSHSLDEQPALDEAALAARSDTMSRRRAMRANRKARVE